ncbi:hypothetical protein VTG60DRAFT_5919 [Thermothelomyces hinnuleus]
MDTLVSPVAELATEAGKVNRGAMPTEFIHRARSQSRSQLSTPSTSNNSTDIGGPVRSYSSASQRLHSENRIRSARQKNLNLSGQALDGTAYKSLLSIKPPSPTEALIKENSSLHQRIAALQRTESDLLNENQELVRKLASAQRRYNSQQQWWTDEMVKKEDTFNARIRDLEARLAQKEKSLSHTTLDRFPEAALNDTVITSWFATKTETWHEWVNDFVHQEPNRVRFGLHPLQLRELCEGVKHFVRLTNKDELPNELLKLPGSDKNSTARVLLHGMLANFIISETFKSPFWVFDAIAVNAYELESPSVPRLDSMSPVGFRMDLTAWKDFNVAPPRDVKPLRPNPVSNDRLAGPQDGRQFPRLVTSIQPPNLSTNPAMSLLGRELPSRQAIESLYQILSEVAGGGYATEWRASLIKPFCAGGMSFELDSIPLTSESRSLAEARLRHAGRLKDSFLRGPARFLLRDQEAAGIEELESRLMKEVDAALRFSCQLWCHQDTLRVCGLDELAGTAVKAASDHMRLYHIQAPLHIDAAGNTFDSQTELRGSHEGHSVIMVIQPSVGASANTKAGKPSKDFKGDTKVWTKASVLVAAPPKPLVRQRSAPLQKSPCSQAPARVQPPIFFPVPASVNAIVGTPIPLAAPPVPPEDAQETALTMLPSIAFRDMPRALVR